MQKPITVHAVNIKKIIKIFTEINNFLTIICENMDNETTYNDFHVYNTTNTYRVIIELNNEMVAIFKIYKL